MLFDDGDDDDVTGQPAEADPAADTEEDDGENA